MMHAVGSTITSVSRMYSLHHNNNGQFNINYLNINITNYYSQDGFFLSPPPSPSPSPSPHSPNILVAYIFPAMVELIQLMCQTGNDKSPFKLHPQKMNLAIASFLIYCFSYDAQLRIIPSSNHRHSCSNYVKIVQFVGSIFGPLTLASYSSVLFPSLVPFLYSVSILYSAFLLLYTTRLTKQLKWFYRKFISGRPTLILPF
ncbi:hypothetical protein R3W88_021459 [Solanum pinnatisectum]|uniref:Uncharacterized protein n=1 Tax=Solanum pinnatisectum TaxID=50273 RepID=A0AAV9LRW0_9SOLN|nr:hypothetical protein R3W88_021459 [Solanum pinnatisectum]